MGGGNFEDSFFAVACIFVKHLYSICMLFVPVFERGWKSLLGYEPV